METVLVVGLGNPGKEYDATRHNIGFLMVDEMASQAGASLSFHGKFNAELAKGRWQNQDIIFAKPMTYMNLSGESVRLILSYFKLPVENLIVICDDLDQAPGAVKMRIGGGHGGHNGIRSILEHTDSDKFYRVKIGIGKPLHKSATAGYVLHRFDADEMEFLRKESFPTAEKRILSIFQQKK